MEIALAATITLCAIGAVLVFPNWSFWDDPLETVE